MIPAWRRSFWKALWFAVLRSRKDKRARASVFGITVLLVSILAELWLLLVLPARMKGGIFQVEFDAFIFGTGLIAFVLIRRFNRKQQESLNFSITGRLTPQLPEQVSSRVGTYLQERVMIVASLFVRAASEIYLANHEVPPGAEVVTRQTQNSTLRKMGLWEKLDPTESVLTSAADGFWTAEQRMEVVSWCEQLRLTANGHLASMLNRSR